MCVCLWHSTAAVTALMAVADTVITSLTGEEITIFVTEPAAQMYLEAHTKVSGWAAP